MTSITVVSEDPATEQRLISLYGEDLAIRRAWSNEWREPDVAVTEICAANPSIVVLADLTVDDAEQLAADLDRRNPGLGVLVLLEDCSNDNVVRMLRAGARDALALDISDEDLQASIDAGLALVAERQMSMAHRGDGPPRRVIVITGPKGGSGKTTIATNLAVGAAERFPGQVLLVDLDTQFGDVQSALGIEPEYSIADAASIGLNERTALKVFLSVHDSGLRTLAAPDTLTAASDLSDADIKRTLAVFIEEFPLVIVDTAAGIDEPSLVAMELATDVVFVASPDVPAIRAVKKQLAALDGIGMNAPRRHLVINRADSRVGLSADEIEDTLGLPAEFRVPSSRQVPISTNEGTPVLLGRKDKVQRSLNEMVDFFAPVAKSSDGRGLKGLLRRDG